MQTVRITTSQNIDIDYQVASLGERIAARIVDYMIFFCVYLIFISVFLASFGPAYGQGNYDIYGINGMIFLIILWLALCVFYDLLTEAFLNGQSIGKRSLKIKVISLSGARPSISQYVLRWVFRIIDFGISLGTAAVISVAFSDNKQRIGDMVAGTTLVKTAPFNKLDDLVFSPPPADYEPVYTEVLQLTDQDILLIHDVIRNFNRTRNSGLIYRLAIRIKNYLNITYPPEVNEYRFLEIVVNDYNCLIGRGRV